LGCPIDWSCLHCGRARRFGRAIPAMRAIPMKRSIVLVVAATMWATFPAQAQKQQFDLSLITCKQFFEYRKDNLSLMLMWLDGYYSEDDAPPIVDFDKMTENSKKLGEYCGKNPAHSVITAADKVLGNGK
jgi:acid stress chaperone HdeB